MAESNRVLIIDNYDSFTFNLVQMVQSATGVNPTVVKNDESYTDALLDGVARIIISPGPGSPHVASDVGIGPRVLETASVPILGVCLGHQLIVAQFGGSVEPAHVPMHGRESEISHFGDELFDGITADFSAVRYHSLEATSLPISLVETARSSDGVNMGVRHRTKPIWGVQFHPESILTEAGERIIRNFLKVDATKTISVPSDIKVESLRFDFPGSAQDIYSSLYIDDDKSIWLDSNGPDSSKQISVLARCKGGLSHSLSYSAEDGATLCTPSTGEPFWIKGSVLDVIQSTFDLINSVDTSGDESGFCPGYMGYVGYGMKGVTSSVPDLQPREEPDSQMLFCDRALVFDHGTNEVVLFAMKGGAEWRVHNQESDQWMRETRDSIAAIPVAKEEKRLAVGAPFPTDAVIEGMFEFRHSRDEYIDRINAAKAHILAGESYEICLTNVLSFPHAIDVYSTYTRLREIAKVPFGALLRFPGIAILSASPELFLRVDSDGMIKTRPIKGTRQRGDSESTDSAARLELRSSIKDRAENLMIVDLMRNDLNRVCRPGTVKVTDLFSVESFESVHQLVSGVEGRLRRDASAVDCLRTTFPGGSMTGAPKIRTLQIIDKLEESPRGVFSGSIGWIAPDGSAMLSIVIRTLVVQPHKVTLGVGGAITHLSDPAEEYKEILLKARVPAAALLDDGTTPG